MCVGWEVGVHADEEMSPNTLFLAKVCVCVRVGVGRIYKLTNMPMSSLLGHVLLKVGVEEKGVWYDHLGRQCGCGQFGSTALGVLSSQNGVSLDGCSCPAAVGNESPQP